MLLRRATVAGGNWTPDTSHQQPDCHDNPRRPGIPPAAAVRASEPLPPDRRLVLSKMERPDETAEVALLRSLSAKDDAKVGHR